MTQEKTITIKLTKRELLVLNVALHNLERSTVEGSELRGTVELLVDMFGFYLSDWANLSNTYKRKAP